MTTRVSVADDGAQADERSDQPTISADGRYVVFVSGSTNLVPRSMRLPQLFGHDLQTGATRVISVNSAGEGSDRGAGGGVQGEAGTVVSATGRVIAFMSGGRNLVPGDTNRSPDIFVQVQRPR